MKTDKVTGAINPRQQVPVKPPKKRRFLAKFLFLLLIASLGIGVYDSLAAVQFLHKVNQNTFTPTGNDVRTDVWQGTERVNLLLMGVDNRAQDQHPRSDTMILLSVDPKTKQGDILSVMRDSYVSIPGQGKDKINAAFAYGGPDLAVQTVKNFLQVPIHYYMVTDFQGFEGIIDAVGGVTLDVEKDMVYQDDGVYDINLKKGVQHLDGKKALMYVRFRHDALSDYARTERQRKLLKALANEMKTPSTLIKLPSILKAAQPYIQTNIGTEDTVKLAALFAQMDTTSMKTVQIPASDALRESYAPDGGAVLVPDLLATQQLVHSLIGQEGVQSASSDNGTKGKGSNHQGNSTLTPESSSQEQGRSMVVTGEYVNIRSGPGLEQKIIGKVYQGDTVQVISTSANGWAMVILPDGTQGYMASQFLQGQ